MNRHQYRCPKCEGRSFKTGELRGAGGFWSKIFDVQGRKFKTITCTHCGYTEFFTGDSSVLGNVFDLFTN